MDTATIMTLFAMFCLMLAFLAVFARPATAKLIIKTLNEVISKLLK